MREESRRDSVEVVLARASGRWREIADSVQTVTGSLCEAVGNEAFASLVPDVAKHQRELERALQRFEAAAHRPEVVLATTGTTSSGKSTLANMLIGEMLLPKAVQEMSAGVVTVRHSADERQLVVEESRGATWPTGTWEDVSAESVRGRLESAMHSYRKLLSDSVPTRASHVEPPRFRITWPTRLGRSPQRFGLPPNADITVADLPGLKYVDDELNGGVIREQARKALCVVAYNSFETDPRKQDALLRQIIDQVKALGGSPARMLFVLNRIDAFRTDADPDESERAFCDQVTQQIRTRIRDALSEYSSEAASIEPIPLSSEPALYAVLASQCDGDEQAALLAQLEDEYKMLFAREDMKNFPRGSSRARCSLRITLEHTSPPSCPRSCFPI
jgi:energy-coupling factor transporter ATP-binding protein EcfA2